MAIPIEELQSSDPSAIIELFELQLVEGTHYATGNPDSVNTLYRWHNGVAMNSVGQLKFNGQTYSALPIDADGFDYKGTAEGSGTLPRPTLRVSNLLYTVTTLLTEVNKISTGNDLLGAKLTRIRTLAKFLDKENFVPDDVIYKVTVSNNQFYLNGVSKPTLNLTRNGRYIFLQDDPSNLGNRFRLIANNGAILSNSLGTPGKSDGRTIFEVPSSATSGSYSSVENGTSYGNTITFSDYQHTGNANMRFPDEIYFIDRKSGENKQMVEFELCSALDMQGFKLPKRICLPREFPGIGSFHE